jgi:class 3 adenylate cyclase
MSTLPTGTVTFVFTDVEGSTALLKRLGEQYRELLSTHRRLIRETFSARVGVEIDTQGDAFFFAFPRAREALAASVEAQRAHARHDWPSGANVRVRMGVHTGEPAVGEEGYHGLDVVRAARICTIGRGGQVLLSETTRALVGDELPARVSVHSLGERHLKDIDEPVRIYALDIEGVEQSRDPVAVKSEEMPVSAPWNEEAFERRLEEAAARHEGAIQEQVLRSIEASLGAGSARVEEGDAVELLAKRSATLGVEIARRVKDAFGVGGPGN